MTPEISVVVPHLNQVEGLARLIESLDAQVPSSVSFEIIVVDNGSIQPLPRHITEHKKVRVLRETAPGPGPARNTGAEAAKGRILGFTDADCVADPNWLAAIHSFFQSRGAGAILGGDVRILPRSPVLDSIEAYESIFGYRQEMYIRRDGFAATCNLAVSRDVFQLVGPFAGIHVAEDREWGRRATANGYKIAFLPDMIIYTPARENFDELARKWDRLIAHDYMALRGVRGRFRWIVRSVMVAFSPIAELPRVLFSRKIRGARTRILAIAILARIRFLRSIRMLQLVAGADARAMAFGWQRK